MPIYDLQCRCGNLFEVICQPDQRPKMACPMCGKKKCRPVPVLPRRERHFSGTEAKSMMYGFHGVGEVAEARQAFADTGAKINDDGSVEFDKRSTQQKFTKRWGEVKGVTQPPMAGLRKKRTPG